MDTHLVLKYVMSSSSQSDNDATFEGRMIEASVGNTR